MSKSSIDSRKIKTVIFDLDGTLIDSAPSILAGLEFALKETGLNPALPLTSSLIGPPLKDVLKLLVGNGSLGSSKDLEYSFKTYYDSEGYKLTEIYPGIQSMLSQLNKNNISLYLATNKRLLPTKKILSKFNWGELFNNVYAIDDPLLGPFEDKKQMINFLLKREMINIENTIYVGDRIEDLEASLFNDLEQIIVNWGYGDFETCVTQDVNFVNSPIELLELILVAR